MKLILLALFILLPTLAGQDGGTQERDKLEHARTVNLDRLAGLPNFVADEVVTRYKSPHTDPPEWRYVDTIEAEIEVHGSGFTRLHTRLNGKPWNKPTFPEFNWGVRFGYEIKPLFSPECHTTIEFDGREQAGGKQLLAWRYHSPQDGCFAVFAIKNGTFSAKKRFNPPRTGRFLIDDPGGNIIQFEENAHDFPKGFGFDSLRQTISWDYVKIGEGTFLLPVASDILGGFTEGNLWHVVVEYKNHRHFEASTNVTFND